MLNEILPENMRSVMEFAGLHPVASIIEEYHNEEKRKKEKEMNEKKMNEAREWMVQSKLNLENFKNYFYKYQDELYKKKEILEKECKVCEKCINIMNHHKCQSTYDTCYSGEYGINIARSCWDCIGCHFHQIGNINIELEESSGELRDYKDAVESATWEYNHARAIHEGRRSKFLIASDIEDYWD
jgi:hypothetical protein